MATSPDRLPEMLACTLHLHDAVRSPGSTLTGSVILSVPTASALALLHPDASAAVDFQQQQQQATKSPASPPSRRWIGTPASTADASESTALLSPSALACAPLSRPFEFELRLQLYGKVIVDGHKVSLASLQRFRPVAATGSVSHMASFKLWSTRVVSWTIPADGDFPRVHAFRATLPDCLPPSFRGSALTCHYYLHAIALAVGGVGKKLMDVKLPFRVRVGDAPMMPMAGDDAAARMANLIEVPAGLVTSMQHCLMTTPSQWTAAKLLETSPPAVLAASQSSTHLLAATPAADSLSADEASALLLTSASPAVSFSPPVAAADSDTSSREGSNPAAAATAPRLLPSPLHLTSAPTPLGVELGAALASASRRSSFSAGGGGGGPASAAASSPFGVPLSMLEQPLAPLTFNISKTIAAPHTPEGELSAHVVRLTLDQRFLRPGDTLRGHLDFSRAGIRCYRVAIALQQEERVQEDCALPSTGGQHSSSSSSGGPFTHRKTFASFHQYTVNTLSTHFLFCLPVDVVSNYQTDLTAVSWQLQFKFITDVDLHPKHSWSFLPAPSSTHAEALVWTLPLTVMPHDDAEVVKQRAIKTMLISPQSFVP